MAVNPWNNARSSTYYLLGSYFAFLLRVWLRRICLPWILVLVVIECAKQNPNPLNLSAKFPVTSAWPIVQPCALCILKAYSPFLSPLHFRDLNCWISSCLVYLLHPSRLWSGRSPVSLALMNCGLKFSQSPIIVHTMRPRGVEEQSKHQQGAIPWSR